MDLIQSLTPNAKLPIDTKTAVALYNPQRFSANVKNNLTQSKFVDLVRDDLALSVTQVQH